MTQFNKGDVVRVGKSDAGDGTHKLTGLIFTVLYPSDHRMPALDVTAAHKRVQNFEAWPYDGGKYGWYVDADELELIAPAKVDAKQYKVTSVRTKRDTPVPKSALSPQCQQLLGLLEAKGSVTALEASGVYRIRSLSRRITDLKDAGYTIIRDLGKDTTGQRYARYYLKGAMHQAVVA